MKVTARTLIILGGALLTAGSATLVAQQGQTAQRNRQMSSGMSGTYELESTRGGDPRRAAEMATRSLPSGQRDRAYQALLGRLDPPQTFSIERNGRNVTIESSRGARSSFEADGQTRTERGEGGRMSRTRTQMVGNQLIVSTTGGSRGSDFSVTFETLNSGNDLRVTRRLDDEDLQRPVTIQSYYRRTADTPRWDVYRQGRAYTQPYGGRSDDSFDGTVRDGTRIVATLDTRLSMTDSRQGEPFTMTVRSPVELSGARIDGDVSRVGGRGRQNDSGADLRIDFRTLHLRGRTFDFDAILNSIRLADGTVVRVNAEGELEENNRRNSTLQNGAVGAAIGAVIGAIAGGGKGAAIGAAVGGTGGVILSQGHGELDLRPGAEVVLTAVSGYRAP
jgi:hypothetical protein